MLDLFGAEIGSALVSRRKKASSATPATAGCGIGLFVGRVVGRSGIPKDRKGVIAGEAGAGPGAEPFTASGDPRRRRLDFEEMILQGFQRRNRQRWVQVRADVVTAAVIDCLAYLAKQPLRKAQPSQLPSSSLVLLQRSWSH